MSGLIFTNIEVHKMCCILKINIFNFVVMYSRYSCSCALLLGTVLLRHKSYKYHDKLVFVPSVLHLLLVNFTSEMCYKACAR